MKVPGNSFWTIERLYAKEIGVDGDVGRGMAMPGGSGFAEEEEKIFIMLMRRISRR
jgi:hypothetical protein